MIQLMLITGDPQAAQVALEAGVNRIFVDLELIGKHERQGHLSTVISGHRVEDVGKIRKQLPNAALLVRTNPLHPGMKDELDAILAFKPEFIMLPMFSSAAELSDFSKMVNGRAKLVPLVETPSALSELPRVLEVPGVAEVFIGLNDLHLALGLKFMFEPLTLGLVDRAASQAKKQGIPFGFGGIGRIGGGTLLALPAELILAEHLRLGSQSVILSRSFQKGLSGQGALKAEIDRLRQTEVRLKGRTSAEIEADRVAAHDKIELIRKKSAG